MTYVPRKGSIAERAIATLAKRGAMTRAALGAALGVKHTNLDGNLAPAIAAGAITRQRGNDGRALFAVATPVPEVDVPAEAPIFVAALYHDGELDVYHTLEITAPGGRPGVRLTRDEVAQLRRLLAGGGHEAQQGWPDRLAGALRPGVVE